MENLFHNSCETLTHVMGRDCCSILYTVEMGEVTRTNRHWVLVVLGLNDNGHFQLLYSNFCIRNESQAKFLLAQHCWVEC